MRRFVAYAMVAAVSVASTVPAFSAMETAEEEALRTYCVEDIQRLCADVPVGEGRVAACLREKEKELSVGCAEALKKLKEERE